MTSAEESSCQNATAGCSKQAEMATAELEENMEYLEQYKGTRRWLGKHHHRGKDHLAHMIRDKQVLTKSLVGGEPPNLTKKGRAQLVEDDGLDFKVAYSLNKNNRWDHADPMNLLKIASASAGAAVIEAYHSNGRNAIAVYSRENFDVENGSFDVRTAKSSGKGQSLSNFAPEARELTQKRPKKKESPVREEKIDCGSEELTVLYNISRPHPNKDVLYNEISQEKSRHRTQTRVRPRGPKELQNYLEEEEGDVSDFDVESEQQEDEESFDQRLDAVNSSIADFFVSEQKRAQKSERTRNRPISVVEREESFELLPEMKPQELVDLSNVLSEPNWLIAKTINLSYNKAFDFKQQVENMHEDEKLDIRWVGDENVVVDASAYTFGNKLQNHCSLFFVFHYINKRLRVKMSTTLAENEVHKTKTLNLMNLVPHSTLRTMVKAISKGLGEPIITLQNFPIRDDYYRAVDDGRDWNWLHHKRITSKLVTSEQLSTLGVVQKLAEMMQFVKDNESGSANWPRNVLSSDKMCHRCLDHSQKDTFLMSDGRFECTNCLRNEVFRQLRCGILPVSLDIALKEGQLVFDALPAILSLPMFVWYIKKCFAELYTAFGAGGKFSECPECTQSVYVEELGPEDTVRCGFCCSGWCIRCNCEPHWPMSCAEFAQWKPKWDIQYQIEDPASLNGECLIEFRCSCRPNNEIIKLLMPVEKVECDVCHLSFGTKPIRSRYEYQRHNWREDEEYTSETFRLMKDFNRCDADDAVIEFQFKRLTSKRLAEFYGRRIRRDVAEPCTEAKKRRTDTINRKLKTTVRNFKEFTTEVRKLPSLFVTALQLVENVTGWAYVTKDTTGLAQMASRLLKHALTTIERLDFDADCQRTAKNVAVLEKMVNDVVAAAQTRSQKIFDQRLE